MILFASQKYRHRHGNKYLDIKGEGELWNELGDWD